MNVHLDALTQAILAQFANMLKPTLVSEAVVYNNYLASWISKISSLA